MPTARLLLIQDKTSSKEFIAPLKNLGYQVVDNLSDGKQTLKRVAELQPDLVLISIHLNGELGGIPIGKQIYNQYDIPVIYISDQSSQNTIQRSGGTAPFGYLFGKEDEKQILATIEVALARHTLEKKVRESEGWLNAILQSIGEGVIAVDSEQCVRFMNPVAEKLTGRKTIEVLGEPLEEILPLFYANSDERVTFSHALAYLFNQNERTGFEATLIGNDDESTQIPLEVSISPIIEKGNQDGMVLSFRDITDRKHSMREVQRHAMRSEAMLRTAEQLNARLDVKAVLNQVCEICNDTLEISVTSAFLFDPIENTLVSATIAVNNKNSEYKIDSQTFDRRYKIPGDLISNVVSQPEPVVEINDIQNFDMPGIPYLELIKDLDVRSLVISGMYQSNLLTGILVAQMNGEIREFTQEELDLLRGLADQASIAVGNAILFEQVVASRERQQSLTRRLVDLQENERRNLAKELHDQIGQMMTGLQFSLNSLLAKAADEEKVRIADAQEQVRKLISLTREISMNLRPSMLDDTGLILTLMWHFKRYKSQTDIKINFQHYNLLEKRFDTAIETAVFRIIQEALTNVARYAKTDSVDIMLKLEGQVIQLEVIDKGQGFILNEVESAAHMGLSSMRERAYAVGGFLDIDTAPAEGTRIHATIPLEGKLERRQHER